jgi:hypothetical protein
LDAEWIKAARKPFSWDDGDDDDDDDLYKDQTNDNDIDLVSWQNGQRWFVTREKLMDLWVLPRDMSNGNWERYADAAIRGEEKVLQQVPQLLRLETDAVLKSAQTVLNDLRLPPALLRKEPILLAMSPNRLKGGFEMSGGDSEACRDTQGLLVEAASNWTPSGDDGVVVAADDDETKTTDAIREENDTDTDKPEGRTTDSIQYVQKYFDNEVSADDVHMESFLGS